VAACPDGLLIAFVDRRCGGNSLKELSNRIGGAGKWGVASPYLVWKYHHDFEGGILANPMVGGDNWHRGAMVGSLLAAANGIPENWLEGAR
jgi:hypothetical protein